MSIESKNYNDFLNGKIKRKRVNWSFYRKAALKAHADYELIKKLATKKKSKRKQHKK